MEFSDDEKEMFTALREDPQILDEMVNNLASTTEWTAGEFASCGIAVWRVREPIYVCTTPVQVIKAPNDLNLRATQLGLSPFSYVMPLTPTAYVSVTLGDFDGAFMNREIALDEELGLKRHTVAQFSYWPIIRHMVCSGADLIDHLKWAGFDCTKDTEKKKMFLRDNSFQTHREAQ